MKIIIKERDLSDPNLIEIRDKLNKTGLVEFKSTSCRDSLLCWQTPFGNSREYLVIIIGDIIRIEEQESPYDCHITKDIDKAIMIINSILD